MAKSSGNISRPNLDDQKFAKIRQYLYAASLTENGYVYVAKFFDNFSKADRQETASFCLDWYDFLVPDSPNPYQALPPLFPKEANIKSAFLAAQIAIIACCSFEEITRILAQTNAASLDKAIEHVLRIRRPKWASKLLLWIVHLPGMENYYGWGFWKIYRQFVAEGITKPIQDEIWTRIMFSSMLYETQANFGNHEIASIDEQLHHSPDLLENEIWNLFELTQFPQGSNLTSIDMLFSRNPNGRKGEDWKGAICSLVKNGEMSKERVIDGCLRSLARPFTDYESRWYAQLLEQLLDKLPITDDELVDHSQRYFNLLDNPNPTPRSLGVKILERLFKTGKIPDQEIIGRVVFILRDPAKSKAKKAITILEKIVMRNLDLRKDVFLVLLEGLQHESVDIQQASLKVLDRYGALNDAAISDYVHRLGELLAPSVRKLLPAFDVVSIERTETTDDPHPISTRSGREGINPVQSFDELLDLATRLLEQPDDIDEIERLFDGLARIGSDRESDFEKRTAPLLKRALKLLRTDTSIVDGNKVKRLADYAPFAGHDLHADLKYLIIAWLTRTVPYIKKADEPFDMKWGPKNYSDRDRIFQLQAFIGHDVYYYNDHYYKVIPSLLVFSARVKHIAEILATARSAQLLATPTHRGGWIDPVVFVERLIADEKSNQEHDDHDRVLALLRLTDEGRDEALKLLYTKLKKGNEYNDAVRYALGTEINAVGKTPHFWIAATRCRKPLSDDPMVESIYDGFGPDAGMVATYQLKTGHVLYSRGKVLLVDRFPASTGKGIDLSLFPTVALHVSDPAPWGDRVGLYPWTFHVWPQNPTPAIATSIDVHARNIDKNYDWGFRYTFTAIAHPDTPFHSMAVTAIFLGLGMKSPQIHTTAIDTAIVTIADGRMTAKASARPIRDLLGLEILPPVRWIKPLKTIAEESKLHAIFIRQLLENIIDSIPPKDVGGFLEILYELGVSLNTPVSLKQCRQYLESYSGSRKAGKLAKKLLEM